MEVQTQRSPVETGISALLSVVCTGVSLQWTRGSPVLRQCPRSTETNSEGRSLFLKKQKRNKQKTCSHRLHLGSDTRNLCPSTGLRRQILREKTKYPLYRRESCTQAWQCEPPIAGEHIAWSLWGPCGACRPAPML